MIILKPIFTALTIMLTIGIADKKAETKRIEKEQTCHGLHKVTDIDDLLLQVYNNLDSHCLFYMPREELSKAWGIPVFDIEQQIESIKYRKEKYGLVVDRAVSFNVVNQNQLFLFLEQMGMQKSTMNLAEF